MQWGRAELKPERAVCYSRYFPGSRQQQTTGRRSFHPQRTLFDTIQGTLGCKLRGKDSRRCWMLSWCANTCTGDPASGAHGHDACDAGDCMLSDQTLHPGLPYVCCNLSSGENTGGVEPSLRGPLPRQQSRYVASRRCRGWQHVGRKSRVKIVGGMSGTV